MSSMPFLPELEPAPPPKNRKAAFRVVGLWALLILMFLAIWVFLQPSPGARDVAPLPPCAPVAETTVDRAVTLAPMVLIFAVFVWWLRRMIAPTGFHASLELGVLALAARRFGESASSFASSAERYANKPVLRASLLLRAAEALMWNGQLDDAVAALERAEKGSPIGFMFGVRSNAAVQLARIHALRGDLDVAQRWSDAARARLAKSIEERIAFGGELVLANAVIALRSGRVEEARALLEEHWLTLRQALNANAMRVAEVIRALVEATGGVRESNVVSERLLRIEPIAPGEFAFLGARWPEMNAFLAAHGLTARAGSVGSGFSASPVQHL